MRHPARFVIAALLTVTAALEAPAFAQEAETASPPPAASSSEPAHFWEVDAGLRASFLTGAGYDRFSRNDALQQFSIGGSRTLVSFGRVSLAGGLRWDIGGSSAKARGADASLIVHRFALPVEARMHATPWIYGFVRLAPGVAWESARVTDPSSPAALERSRALFSGDASVGATVLFRAGASRVRWGLSPEVGYGVVPKMNLGMSPALADSDPRRIGTTEMGGLVASGAFVRVSAVAAF